MAKDTINCAVTPEVRADLLVILHRGLLDGQDFRRHGKPNRSAVMRYAIREAAKACAAPAAVMPALPERTTITDGDRLKAAREAAGLTRGQLAEVLGYKDESSIRNMETRGFKLSDKARTWLAANGGVE